MSESDREPRWSDEDDTRKGLFSRMPRGFSLRVVVLLAALVGVILLQQKTGQIAGCLNQALMAVPATPVRGDGGAFRVRVVLPPAAPDRRP